MRMTRTLLRSTALALPPQERAALAAELLESLDNVGDEQDVTAAWDAEIGRRILEIERGEVKTISADQVMQRLR
jgi:putative addiction module component (TIGR02574 family)